MLDPSTRLHVGGMKTYMLLGAFSRLGMEEQWLTYWLGWSLSLSSATHPSLPSPSTRCSPPSSPRTTPSCTPGGQRLLSSWSTFSCQPRMLSTSLSSAVRSFSWPASFHLSSHSCLISLGQNVPSFALLPKGWGFWRCMPHIIVNTKEAEQVWEHEYKSLAVHVQNGSTNITNINTYIQCFCCWSLCTVHPVF